MNKALRIRPSREGLLVLFPGTRRALEAEGEVVTLTTYWRRRLSSGDVLEVQPRSKSTPNKSPTPAPRKAREE